MYELCDMINKIDIHKNTLNSYLFGFSLLIFSEVKFSKSGYFPSTPEL